MFTAQVSLTIRPWPFPAIRLTLSLAIHAPREAVEDVVIQGVHIPKGTTVVMYPAVIQHNPVIWGEDCDEFNPDR